MFVNICGLLKPSHCPRRWQSTCCTNSVLFISGQKVTAGNGICDKAFCYSSFIEFIRQQTFSTLHVWSSYSTTTSFGEKASIELRMWLAQPHVATERTTNQTIFSRKHPVRPMTPWILDILIKSVACSLKWLSFCDRMWILVLVAIVGISLISVLVSFDGIIKRTQSTNSCRSDRNEMPPASNRKLPK